MSNCEHCGTTLVVDVDHWCRCTSCDAELPHNDYDDLCERCWTSEWQMEAVAGRMEQEWHNDH